KLLYQSADGEGQGAVQGQQAHTYGIIDAKPGDNPKKVGDGVLKLDGMRAEIDPTQEWKQIFSEVWRHERDYLFEPAMKGENWDSKLRSPLTESGVNVKEGDYLVAVNGRALRVPQNPYELFVNTANENVTLTVNSKPSEDGARHVQVKPIPDDFGLRELKW